MQGSPETGDGEINPEQEGERAGNQDIGRGHPPNTLRPVGRGKNQQHHSLDQRQPAEQRYDDGQCASRPIIVQQDNREAAEQSENAEVSTRGASAMSAWTPVTNASGCGSIAAAMMRQYSPKSRARNTVRADIVTRINRIAEVRERNLDDTPAGSLKQPLPGLHGFVSCSGPVMYRCLC